MKLKLKKKITKTERVMIFFTVILTLLGTSMASPKKSEEVQGADEIMTITGAIKYFGSEPFVKTGFITDDGREYILETEEEFSSSQNGQKNTTGTNTSVSIKEIEKFYGKRLELTGKEWKSPDITEPADSETKHSVRSLNEGKFFVQSYKVLP